MEKAVQPHKSAPQELIPVRTRPCEFIRVHVAGESTVSKRHTITVHVDNPEPIELTMKSLTTECPWIQVTRPAITTIGPAESFVLNISAAYLQPCLKYGLVVLDCTRADGHRTQIQQPIVLYAQSAAEKRHRVVFKEKVVHKEVEVQVPVTVERVVHKEVRVEVPVTVEVPVEVPGPERRVEVPGPERIVYLKPGETQPTSVERVVHKEVPVPGPTQVVRVEVPKEVKVPYIVERVKTVKVAGPFREKIVEKIAETTGIDFPNDTDKAAKVVPCGQSAKWPKWPKWLPGCLCGCAQAGPAVAQAEPDTTQTELVHTFSEAASRGPQHSEEAMLSGMSAERIAEADKTTKAAQAELATAKTELAEASSVTAARLNERSELATLEREATAKRIGEADKATKAAQAELATAKTELAEASSVAAKNEEECSKVKRANLALTMHISTADSTLVAAQAAALKKESGYENELTALGKQLADAKADVIRAESSAAKAKEESEAAALEREATVKQFDEANKATKAAHAKLAASKTELAEASSVAAKNEEEHSRLNMEISAANAEVLAVQAAALKKESDYENELTALGKQLADAEADVIRAESSAIEAKEESEAARSTLVDVETEAAKKESEYKAKLAEMKRLTNVEIQSRNTELALEKTRYKQEIELVAQQLNTETAKLAERAAIDKAKAADLCKVRGRFALKIWIVDASLTIANFCRRRML
eukprot:COSAG02_NODE_1274_length_13507_cov_8.324060_10_plen_713_part_00